MHGGVGEEEDASNPIKSNPSGLPELLSFPHRAPFMLNNSKFMTRTAETFQRDGNSSEFPAPILRV